MYIFLLKADINEKSNHYGMTHCEDICDSRTATGNPLHEIVPMNEISDI
jgi:hypothetical protein